MLISHHFGARIAILFSIISVSTSVSPCNWKPDVDCWLLCTGSIYSDVTLSAEQKWTERSECHAEGIALGLFGIYYKNMTVEANWFQAKVKVNYLEFGTGVVNEIEDNAFNADAFKSVKHLSVTKMDLYELKKGLFNGLESLEILNLKQSSLVRSVDMGILDALNQTLKELTIEADRYPRGAALTIESFTGSQQTMTLEYMRVRYYLHRLTSQSFLSLTNIKHLDVSYCGIEYIGEGTFDPVIGSVKVLRLMGNEIKKLPAGMLDLVPLTYDTYIFMGNERDCECTNLPINFMVKVNCELESDEVDNVCSSFLPTELRTTPSINTNAPTTLLTSTTNEDTSISPTQTDSTTSEMIDTSTTVPTSSTNEDLSVPPTETDSTTVTTASSTSPILKLQVNEFKSGDVILYVYVSKEHSKLILFVSEEARAIYTREVNCPISESSSRCSVTVKNLKESSNYTFCVTDDLDETNEPLCIQYKYTTREPSYLQLWFFKISSTMIVVIAAMMCILLVIICCIAFLSKH